MSLEFYAYVDGSCQVHTTRHGGWGVYIIAMDNGKVVEVFENNGVVKEKTTGNKMELLAAAKVFEKLPDGSKITVFSDSMNLIKGMTDWLPKRLESDFAGVEPTHMELWKELIVADHCNYVTWKWVSRNSGIKGNKEAHRLSQKGFN